MLVGLWKPGISQGMAVTWAEGVPEISTLPKMPLWGRSGRHSPGHRY